MKNEEKLLLAIGEISDDIIAEVSTPYTRKSVPMKRTLAIAASIAVVTVGITLLPGLLDGKFDKSMGGNAAAPEMSGGMSGDVADGSGEHFGSLAYVGRVGESSFNFNLMLDMTTIVNISLKSADGTVIYTTEDIADEGVEIRHPTITVNGEAAEALPSHPGEYDITVSFDGMEGDVEWSEYITFDPFGRYFCFN